VDLKVGAAKMSLQEKVSVNRFDQKIISLGDPFQKGTIEALQVNVGRFCNMSCSHCHVEAGPTQTEENMDEATAQAVIRFLKKAKIHTMDITGGAPELNPHFKFLVQEARAVGAHVMDRCNLTVLLQEGTLAPFLAAHEVEVIASLPCYSQDNVDRQRGSGAFQDSIQALRLLNQLGYGKTHSPLLLNLVYNPVGPHLPPDQEKLEATYHERLFEDFGVSFHHLYTITNMPITRYEKYLKAFGQYEKYIDLLEKHFNPDTVKELMCRRTLSVGWDGKLYDCDFNLALSIPILDSTGGSPMTIFHLSLQDLVRKKIRTGNHCFGCAAGRGSSCGGALS